jgi:hypothetical protein
MGGQGTLGPGWQDHLHPLAAQTARTSICGGSGSTREHGRTVGEPFVITRYDSPAHMISTNMGNTEIGISASRALLTFATVTGNIWDA